MQYNVLSLFQIVGCFGSSRFIGTIMHLDIYYTIPRFIAKAMHLKSQSDL
jgi:hypothetical protein